MLRKIRKSLALVLLALIPFHALLVTVLTKLVAGPNHAPLGWLVLWKEALLAVVLAIALMEIVAKIRKLKNENGKDFQISDFLFQIFSPDWIDICILFLLGLSVLVTLLTHRDPGLFAIGFKYDFVPLVAFLLLRRVEWSDAFWRNAKTCLLWAGAVMAAYGLIGLLLPESFFYALGYSDLHSLYIPDRPIAAFQYIEAGGLRRMQSAMSGPNQLGIWLLLPWGIFLSRFASLKKVEWLFGLLIASALILTFSRSAWIAAVVMTAVFFLMRTKDGAKQWKSLAWIGGAVAVIGIVMALAFPSAVTRLASSSDHLKLPLEAVHTMLRNPYGLGLGSAGPASSKRADTCVFLAKTDDVSWAVGQPLCVFQDGTQVQPTDRTCACPVLTENWYLQIGVELGWIGFMIYLLLMLLVLSRLLQSQHRNVFLMFLGVSVVGFFLHSFEDSAVAYSVWLLVAAAFSRQAPSEGYNHQA